MFTSPICWPIHGIVRNRTAFEIQLYACMPFYYSCSSHPTPPSTWTQHVYPGTRPPAHSGVVGALCPRASPSHTSSSSSAPRRSVVSSAQRRLWRNGDRASEADAPLSRTAGVRPAMWCHHHMYNCECLPNACATVRAAALATHLGSTPLAPRAAHARTRRPFKVPSPPDDSTRQ